MQVVFLCGGAGERMYPITEDKCLLKFLGKTLLEHRIEQALAAGLNDIVTVGNQRIIDRLGAIVREFPQAHVDLAIQGEASGMADALRSTQNLVGDEIIVVSPSDIFEESAYHQVLAERNEGSAASYLLGARVNSYFPGGYLVVNEKNEIRHIVEKPAPGAEPSNVVNIVLHLHSDSRALFRYLAKVKDRGSDAYEQALEDMISEGHKLKLVEYSAFWGPIKYPWHLLAAMEYFLEQSPGASHHRQSSRKKPPSRAM